MFANELCGKNLRNSVLQDTPWIHPCRLDGSIPAANGLV